MEGGRFLVMIIGNGLMARACERIYDNDCVIFASGVSNSQETDQKLFEREERLLKKVMVENEDKVLVYFGTASEPNTPYIRHKYRLQEQATKHKRHIVLNLAQVVGCGGNPNTFFNSMATKIINEEKIIIRFNAMRSLIDIDDMVSVLSGLLRDRKYGSFNFTGAEVLSPLEIVCIMGEELKIIPKTKTVIGQREDLPSNSKEIDEYISSRREGYTRKVIRKYLPCIWRG